MLNIILLAVTATTPVTANIVDICSFTHCDKSVTVTIPTPERNVKSKETVINYE